MYQQPNAPRSIGGVLDSGFKLYRESLPKVFVIAALASIVSAPGNLVAPYVVANGISLRLVVAVIAGLLVMVVVVAALNNALIARIDSIASSSPKSLREALGVGVRRTPATILCGLVMSFFAILLVIPGGILAASVMPALGSAPLVANPGSILLALVVLFVPVSVVAIWFVFAPSAVVVERFGPLQSLGFSFTLVRGHWWRTAVLLTLLGILMFALYIVVGIVAGVSAVLSGAAIGGDKVPWAFNLVVGPAVSALVVPLVYSLLLSIYYDLKVRHEGGDLAARIAAAA
jgi:uncharacterized membrane protein (DUF485 family)